VRELRGGRQVAARAVAAASASFWALPFFGVVDLAVPIDRTPGFYDAYLLETGWGVLYTFVVAAAFVALAARPQMMVPVLQILLAAACLAVTAIAAGSWVQLFPATLLAANCYVVAVVARHRVLRPARWSRPRLDRVVGVPAVTLVPPAALFAVDMVTGFREGRPPLDDDTWGIDHWPTQAAAALTVAAVAVAVAAGVRARWSGTAAGAGCVAAAAAWFGSWSVAYPDHAGSAGGGWGIALVVWACVFLGLVARRLATASPGRSASPRVRPVRRSPR
jgi:hypothetical protein